MTIVIDHIVNPAYDHEASARFFARIMELTYDRSDRHFAPVKVSETFTIAFIKTDQLKGYHLGFHIGEEDFDPILGRLQAAGVPYGNDPREPANRQTDHPFGGREVFFLCPNGHLFEVMTIRQL